ncbi:luciferin sulfotransferase-like [Pollicipes pollicipes]|uniref:luciferin sulfotransferase-like n=1 Tax=Pollicipes pollicipes TaxID=41117 RepID=UPI0018859C78|nr:luciferin sulfotransferase-like [Pollicipes pollicipes]
MSLGVSNGDVVGEQKRSRLHKLMPWKKHKLSFASPVAFEPYDTKTQELLKKNFGVLHNLQTVWPGGICLPTSYKDIANKVYNLPLRATDVWVMSFPKTGSTWTQEMVWCIGNDCDLTRARSLHMDVKFPLLEHWINSKGMMSKVIRQKGLKTTKMFAMLNKNPEIMTIAKDDTTAILNRTPRNQRRFAKTHIFFSLLPPRILDVCKIVYVARNPKDTVVSYYHHNLLFKGLYEFRGDFKTFVDLFMANILPWCPYWENLRQAWSRRHHPNMCFIMYEDMKEDLLAVVRKVSAFLEKDLTEQQVTDLCEHLSFSSMSKNDKVNREVYRDVIMDENKKENKFIRKGQIGDWKNYFDEDLNRRFDAWIQANSHGIDIEFKYE